MRIEAKLRLYSGEAYIIGFVYNGSRTKAICVLADSGEIIEQPLDWVTITDTSYLTQEWKRK